MFFSIFDNYEKKKTKLTVLPSGSPAPPEAWIFFVLEFFVETGGQ
jgi:hypothetical protein